MHSPIISSAFSITNGEMSVLHVLLSTLFPFCSPLYILGTFMCFMLVCPSVYYFFITFAQKHSDMLYCIKTV